MTSEAETSLTEWAGTYRDRDHRVRNAFAAGVTKSRIHAITGISRATIDRILKESAMLVTITDIQDKVAATLEGTTFDVDAIADELMRTYDIVGPAPAMTFDEIDHDEYWAIIVKHDNGDRTITISALNPTTQVWEVIEREPAKGKMIAAIDSVELVAEDFGGVVGDTYRVEIRDPEDNVLRHADAVAR